MKNRKILIPIVDNYKQLNHFERAGETAVGYFLKLVY